MKTIYSNYEYAKKVALLIAQAAHVNPPAIPFRRTKPKDDEAESEDDRIKKIRIRLEPDDEDSDEFESRCFLFDNGDAERWVKWRIQFEELIRDVPLNDGTKKIKYAKALLTGDARERFVNIVADLRHADADENPDETYNEAIAQMGRFYFGSPHAYRRQKSYLRYNVFMMDMSLADFRAELLRQNNMLRYFPIPDDRDECEVFSDDELVEIVDRAKRVEWQRDLLTANIDPYSMKLDEYYKYLEKLEQKYEMDEHLRSGKREKEKQHQARLKKTKATIASASAAKTAITKRKTSERKLVNTAANFIQRQTKNVGHFRQMRRIIPTNVNAVTARTCFPPYRWKQW